MAAMGSSRICRPNPHGDSQDVCSIVFEYADGLIHEHSGLALPTGINDELGCKVIGQTGYGVVNYWISRRRQEFGVRLALGASRGRVTRQVVGETLMLIAAATVLGVAGAAACTRLLSSYLYQVEPTDPATMAAVVALVVVTMLLAAYLPARRAASTDPLVALRQD
jgi:hypothetical protein